MTLPPALRYIVGFVAIYAAALTLLVVRGQPLEDVIGALLILGVFLPAVALFATVRMRPPEPPEPWRPREAWLLPALLAWVVGFLIVKGPLLDALLPTGADPRLRETLNALLKLSALVVVPGAVLYAAGFRWSQAGRPVASRARLMLAFVVVAAAGFAVQALIGSQFKRLLAGDYAMLEIWLGGALCYAWVTVEAGIVEEFFFRWFLQSRLAAWTRSELAGVLIGALLFGLAHAPGILLRGAGASEGLGETPDVLTTLAYVVTTQGIAGLAFGVLWARTRSFLLVVALHGFIDALSNSARFIDLWLR